MLAVNDESGMQSEQYGGRINLRKVTAGRIRGFVIEDDGFVGGERGGGFGKVTRFGVRLV